MEMSRPKEYSFESPLLVTVQELVALPAETWQSGEDWVKALQERTDVLGIVLPLEIKDSPHQSRQDLSGIELLNWLRWSADDMLRYIPVLTVAWQSLDAVLRHTPNLLLVTCGTNFVRLPEAGQTLHRFIDGVRAKSSAWPPMHPEDLARVAGGSQAEQISYHDLANEYYAAHRLWEGYKYAVAEAQIKAEEKRTQNVALSFTEELRHKLAKPTVKEYLGRRKQQASPVYYPITDDWQEMLRAHAEQGLPGDTRILMVDDEFDKGLAEVLLQMLFKASEFSFRLDGEWVYSPDDWARLVCVKSTREAACWLKHWKDADTFDDLNFTDETSKKWLLRWATEVGSDVNKMRSDERKKASKWILGGGDETARIVDCRPAKIAPTTVLLLDLHLEKRETTVVYDPLAMTSVRLWTAVKDKTQDLPIIVFTASRQSMNYAAIMETAGKSDGWLTKEGPDITLEGPKGNEHSSWAALYLLERIQMFSRLKGWYRTEFCWKIRWKIDYSNAYLSPHWPNCLGRVAGHATRIFNAIRHDESFLEKHSLNTLKSCVGKEVSDFKFIIERLLVERRVIIAALFHTAKWENNQPTWVALQFSKMMPNSTFREIREAEGGRLEYVNDVLNFKHFWLNSSEAILPKLLLPEECEWLKQTFPVAEYPQIHAYLDQAREAESA